MNENIPPSGNNETRQYNFSGISCPAANFPADRCAVTLEGNLIYPEQVLGMRIAINESIEQAFGETSWKEQRERDRLDYENNRLD